MFGGQAPAAAWAEERFEESVVNALFAHYGLPGGIKRELREAYAMGEGRQRLSLEGFHARFPSFPVRLAARIPPQDVVAWPLAKFFTRLAASPLVTRWEELADECSDLVLGVVFRWPYLGRQAGTEAEDPGQKRVGAGLVLSNAEPDWSVPGVRMVWQPPPDRSGLPQLILEPFSVLLAEIDAAAGGKWEPDYE